MSSAEQCWNRVYDKLMLRAGMFLEQGEFVAIDARGRTLNTVPPHSPWQNGMRPGEALASDASEAQIHWLLQLQCEIAEQDHDARMDPVELGVRLGHDVVAGSDDVPSLLVQWMSPGPLVIEPH